MKPAIRLDKGNRGGSCFTGKHENRQAAVRTIQRDMDAIDLAGIPVISMQGPSGGYGIMDGYRMDRRLVTADDLFFIITALRGIGESLDDRRIDDTLEKMRGLLPEAKDKDFKDREGKLHIDFSMLGGGPDQRKVFKTVQTATDAGRLLRMDYTNNRLERETRIVEPMTVVFQWLSWYLYAFCRLREGYRLFRISRIREPKMLGERFRRRDYGFEAFSLENGPERTADGCLIARTRMPEDGWMYGYILSYGAFVEVLEPPHIRDIIKSAAGQISRIYE